ncbi:MAG: radical SAM protein [Clostridia bacterium]|nr:radical SAM protein [Clostridia bacterium]
MRPDGGQSRFPLFALARHRLATDGQGVTTLAAAYGCPLRCRYCLNPQSWRDGMTVKQVTARELYDLVKVDDLYFQATDGGVTFGGGEPLLNAPFIREFRGLCGDRWRLRAETCLNISDALLQEAMACVDEFIVDVKDMNPAAYLRYTGAGNSAVYRNLTALVKRLGPARVLARVPLIPGFNTPEDIDASLARLRELGVTRFDTFTYRTPAEQALAEE